MDFIKRYKRRLQTLSYTQRAFFAGSSSEIPAAYLLTRPTDFDLMMYRADLCAIPKNAHPPLNFRGEVLAIELQAFSPGYVKLHRLKPRNNSSECTQDYQRHLQKFHYDVANGPAVTTDMGWSTFTFDKVFSVQCPYWPPEAEEWITRHRPHGWPSKDLVSQIVSEGCFLVGKAHPQFKDDDDDTQWRYSFSKAEVRLISSWTDSQKYVYHVLRLIKSEIVKGGADRRNSLSTYHLKTQMFWACEEKATEFWEESNLLTSICELLTQMEQRLAERNFPNYFLRDCNIIEGNLNECGFRDALNIINSELGRTMLKSKLPPRVCHECRFSITLPLEMAIFGHLFAERFGVPFQAHRPKLDRMQELLDEELDDLMNGISNMQLAEEPGDHYYASAEQHFSNSVTRARRLANSVAILRRITLSHRISLNIVEAAYESLENAESPTLEDECDTSDISAAISCTDSQCHLHVAGRSLNFPWNHASGKFSEKWPNPSHLLSAAFLINLYFRTGHFDVANEIANCEHNLALNASNSELFPMIFCPELASLFDENIQEVLGLIWLCKYLRDGETIFEFCTCPLLFIIYLRLQSSLRLGDLKLVGVATVNFVEHRQMCNFRLYLHSCYYVLLEMAWRKTIRNQGDVLAIWKRVNDEGKLPEI